MTALRSGGARPTWVPRPLALAVGARPRGRAGLGCTHGPVCTLSDTCRPRGVMGRSWGELRSGCVRLRRSSPAGAVIVAGMLGGPERGPLSPGASDAEGGVQDRTDGAITVMLADDHAIVRTGLRLLLEGEEGLSVVAEAGDIPTVMRKVRGH